MPKKTNINAPLVWIDLEMTGLNFEKDVILELAVVLTDSRLDIIAQGPNVVIHQPQEALKNMDEWPYKHHKKSGLLSDVAESKINLEQVQQQVMSFLKEYCQPQQSPLCGNSVWQDKQFLQRYMPEVTNFLHYRIIDVSSVKGLINRWYPEDFGSGYKKKDGHRAYSDILESINELKWYRERFFK